MTRWTSVFLTTALIVVFVAATVSYAGSGCCPSADKTKDQKSPAMKAPEFTLTNYDGKEIALADFKGKVVVLEWFNYDCPFVKYHYETIPTMLSLAKKYADKDVVWLSINSTNYATVENNKAFAQNNGVPYPILDDHKGNVGHAYKAARTPEIFVIDPNGQIAYHGAIDNAPFGKLNEGQTEKIDYADNALAELLAGKEINVPNTKPYGCSVKYNK